MSVLEIAQVKQIEEHTNYIFEARYSPKGDRLASASWDETVTIWNTREWTKVHTLKHTKDVNALSWHSSGEELLSVGDDGLRHWNTKTGEQLAYMDVGAVWSVGWFPSGEKYACGDDKGNVYIYSREGQKQCTYAFGEEYNKVYGLTVVSESQLVAVASTDIFSASRYRLCLLSFSRRSLNAEWQAEEEGYWSRASPLYCGRYILVASSGKNAIDMWNLQTRQVERQIERESDGWCRCAMVGEDGEHIYAGDGEELVVWERRTGYVVKEIKAHSKAILGIAVNPFNPLEFVSYSYDKSFIVWHIKDRAIPEIKLSLTGLDSRIVEIEGMLRSWVYTVKTQFKTMQQRADTALQEKHEHANVVNSTLLAKVDERTTMHGTRLDHVEQALRDVRTSVESHESNGMRVEEQLHSLSKQMHAQVAHVAMLQTQMQALVHEVAALRNVMQAPRTMTHDKRASYPLQGNILRADDYYAGKPLSSTWLSSGDVVVVQHSGMFLQLVKGNDLVPVAHFAFVRMDAAQAMDSARCKFVVHAADGHVSLVCAFRGMSVAMQEHSDIYDEGYIAAISREGDPSARLTIQAQGEHTRFTGPEGCHLVCTAIRSDYCILTACSIVPEPSGLFTVTKVTSSVHGDRPQ